MKETDITKPLIRWLNAHQWEVYQEVQLYRGGGIADIVATQGKLVWVVEVKTGLTTSVVAQAMWWIDEAHYVSVATPERRHTKGRIVLEQYMRWKGIGWINADCHSYGGKKYFDEVTEQIRARLHRGALVRSLRDALCDAHKTFAEAGNANGKRWTPFQETARKVVESVKANPGCNLKFLVEAVDHHYASTQAFKTHIAGYIRSGVIKGIEIREDGRKLRFYPENEVNDGDDCMLEMRRSDSGR